MKENKNEITSYIQGLRRLYPEDLPKGADLVKEGVEIGGTFEAGYNRFNLESGFDSHIAYKKDCMSKGKIVWQLLLGLGTLDEQVEGIKYIYDYCKRLGFEMNVIQCIPSPVIALPEELRDQAPRTTSYMIDSFEDYKKHLDAAPMEFIWGDHHLCTPDAVNSTINALKAGSPHIGEFSQFIWDHPGFDDDVKRYSDMVKALGIMQSKRDRFFVVETYLDDGFPGFFMDLVSYVAYALLEKYITVDLCGARYSCSFGGLLAECESRIPLAMALSDLLSTEEQPALSYINSSTTKQWDHDIDANYGFSAQEFLLEILAERKYRMGLGINPVSITEAQRVATVQELCNILSVGMRQLDNIEEWDRLIDWTAYEKKRDGIKEKAVIMFNNILEGFEAAGIDIKDPLQWLLILKKFNRSSFETMFHPSVDEFGDFKPYYPTELGRDTIEKRDALIEKMSADDLEGKLNGMKVVVASADTHTYGLNLVEGALKWAGAEVINGGLDVEPVDLLDIADEENASVIGISAHNGQALGFARQLLELAKERNKEYFVFMGGVLNGILPGHSEPVDVSDMINELGVHADDDIEKTIRKLIKL